MDESTADSLSRAIDAAVDGRIAFVDLRNTGVMADRGSIPTQACPRPHARASSSREYSCTLGQACCHRAAGMRRPSATERFTGGKELACIWPAQRRRPRRRRQASGRGRVRVLCERGPLRRQDASSPSFRHRSDRNPAFRSRKNRPAPPLGRSDRHLKSEAVSLDEGLDSAFWACNTFMPCRTPVTIMFTIPTTS